jgi:penicillin-binding protein 1A
MIQNPPLLDAKKQIQDKRQGTYAWLVRWFWRLIIGGFAGIFALFIFINFTGIPSFRDLEDPASSQASEVLASNMQTLGRYYVENRVPVTYSQLSPHLVNALIATEDMRYRDHCGIDAEAVARVVVRTLFMQSSTSGGGSTITQQLAKMLYSDRDFQGMSKARKTMKLVFMKLREWVTAVKLERAYTKEEIIAMYLNQYDFINGAQGIRSAAETYFQKPQDKLNVEEAALLIGMLQNASLYNPLRFPEKCIRRRMVVLKQMQNVGYLTENQYDALKVKPLDMTKFNRATHSQDKAPYLCMEIRKDISKILDLPECKKPDGGKYNIYRDGLRIYTTIDPVYQAHAEEAVLENMRKIQARFFDVWKGRDPWRHKISEETTDEDIEGRLRALNKIMRASDRYQVLRSKYLDSILEKMEVDCKLNLTDDHIELMAAEGLKSGVIGKMFAKKQLSAEVTSGLRLAMKSKNYAELKKQFRALDAAADRVFQTRVPNMKIYNWRTGGEKDTMMSPLDSVIYHRMCLQTGVLAIDPKTSTVKAWVGGLNYRFFQFDHIRTDRQVGSTFKPFVYATAISQQGLSPCYHVYDQAVTIPPNYQNFKNGTAWTPKDAKGFYSGRLMTLKEALKNSVNSVSAYLMKQMGDTEPVRGLVHNLGIDSTTRRANGEYRVPKQPSICLGAADLSVWDMTSAYSTFANNGVHATAVVIKKIEDKNGRVIWQAASDEKPALSPAYNFAMVTMLKYNVSGAAGFSALKSEVGGKTGTTNNYSDGWFMGITPTLVVGTWVGGEDRWVRFLTLDDGQGSKMARPIFLNFIGKLEKDPTSGYLLNERFQVPVGDLGFELDCSKSAGGGGGAGRDSTNRGDFQEERFNDEEESTPVKKPAGDGFGDERIN